MLTIVLGTRPEMIKLAPVMRELDRQGLSYTFIHSKQHYDQALDGQIASDLGLRSPDYTLDVGSGSHASQTANIMLKLDSLIASLRPEIIMVQGDTNTVLAASLVAAKMNIPIAHVEAGLRSGDWRMPEEINRVVTDRLSTLHYAPSAISVANLAKEGIAGNHVIVTGNTVVDMLIAAKPNFANSNILSKLGLTRQSYLLLTAHRQENVDDPNRLQALLNLASHATQSLSVPMIWPVHPRTGKILTDHHFILPENLTMLSPIGYFDMLKLESEAKLILSDSGGIQEEAYILKVPIVTLRNSTERPETLTANFLIDTNVTLFDHAWSRFMEGAVNWGNALGDGHASEIIVASLLKFLKEQK